MRFAGMVAIAGSLLVSLTASSAFAQEADLSVSGARSNFVDGSIGVTVTVDNNGPDGVFDLDVSVAFDDTLVTATDIPEGCSGSSVGAACSFGTVDIPVLAAGDSRVLEFTFDGPAAGASATIRVNSTTADPNETNDETTVSLEELVEADLSIEASGIIAGERRTLVLSVSNDGPDPATRLSAAGTVTVTFDEPQDTPGVSARTGMEASGSSVCGRQVPELSEPATRVTIPVNCSLADLGVGDATDLEFWFEGASNAFYRLQVSSAEADPSSADNQLDGDFLNTPTEDRSEPVEEGCCSVTAPGRTPSWLAAALLVAVALLRRRRQSGS